MKFGLKVVLVVFFFLFHAKLKKKKTPTKQSKQTKAKQKTEYLSGINSYLTTYLHAKTIILSLDIWKMEYM